MLKVWKSRDNIKFFKVGINLYLFKFAANVDMWKVWIGQPWMFNLNLICIKQFDGLILLSALSFKHTDRWVQMQVHDLLFGCMSISVGEQIHASIGRVKEVDVDSSENG